MLPTAHVELTWGALRCLQQRLPGRLANVDYRGVAAAAILPDLIDKPLAIWVLPHSGAALLWAHTLLVHAGLWLTLLARRAWGWLPYALAFSGHLAADRMWGFPQTLLWPLRGRQFHQWRHVGTPQEFAQAYRDIVREEPKLVLFEVAGLLTLGWLVWRHCLWQPRRLWRFVASGRLPEGA
ncbi:MAG: metal-dependent hydrolase [Chloroflexi bacterium]|nr:metal-dependent hydrolase [Chloroflexota bacterium]